MDERAVRIGHATAGMDEWRALAEYLLAQERRGTDAAPADAARGLAAVIHVQPADGPANLSA
jgi:hypothetical protein